MRHSIFFATFLSCLLTAAAAFACDPAPNHSVAIGESDTPECLLVEDAFSYGAGALRVTNDCETAARVEALDCVACDAALEVEPGETGEFVIESRALEEGATSSQELGWSVGEDEGVISTRVGYRDNSDACDGWGRNNAACTVSSGRTSTFPLVLLLGVALWGLRRRVGTTLHR